MSEPEKAMEIKREVARGLAAKRLNAIIDQYRGKDLDGIDPHMLIILKQLEKAEIDLIESSRRADELRKSLEQATTQAVGATSRTAELQKLMLAIIEADIHEARKLPQVA